jgi:hypothetical protein
MLKRSVARMDFDENYKSVFADDDDESLTYSDQHKIIRKVNDV